MQVAIGTKLDIKIAQMLDEYCKKTGLPKARVINAALEEYLKKGEFKNG